MICMGVTALQPTKTATPNPHAKKQEPTKKQEGAQGTKLGAASRPRIHDSFPRLNENVSLKYLVQRISRGICFWHLIFFSLESIFSKKKK